MTTATAFCSRCRSPIAPGTRFCANCGNDISGVWSGSNPALGGTIAVEADPHVDTLAQLLSEATLGEYDIYGELGRGGMAAVYLGLDLALNRKVAIKTMLPELISREGMVQRFKREAQTAAALNHPHIIQIYTVKQNKSLVYFVMKFIEGRSLESVIQDKGQVPLPMAQTILGQVGGALAYAHRKGVIHRDVKPANVMIDEDGWAIVTDFGIAKVQEAQNLTATGTAIGTPHYMSPEQFHNKAVTGLSDQYSLGVVAYEMFSGRKPFDGATYAEIITQHLFESPSDLRTVRSDLPEHVVDAVSRMLAKDPSQRFLDLDAATAALGSPASKTEGDVVRTQMISLAKSGPQKKVRMSVPMSPIPVTRKSPPVPTVIEPARKPPARAQQKKPKSRVGLVLTLVVLAALVAGGAYLSSPMGRPLLGSLIPALATKQVVASKQPTPAPPIQQTTSPAATDSAKSVAQVPPVVDSAKIQDSIRTQMKEDSLRLARAAFISESLKIVRAESIKVARNDKARRAKEQKATAKKDTAVALAATPKGAVAAAQGTVTPAGGPQAAATAPAPQPAATGTGTIRIGTRMAGAALYINDKIDNLLSSPRAATIPAGVAVQLSIRSPNCASWDTTVTVAPGTNTTIGFRGKC